MAVVEMHHVESMDEAAKEYLSKNDERKRKIQRISEEAEKGNKVLIKHKMSFEFLELIDLKDERLLHVNSEETAKHNKSIIARLSANLNPDIFEFLEKVSSSENLGVVMVQFTKGIHKEPSPCEGLMDILKSFL